MDNKTYFQIYSVDYPIGAGMHHFGPMINSVGIIEKDKFHDFIDSYRKSSHECLSKARKEEGYESIDQTVTWKSTSPFLEGKIEFVTKYKDGNEYSFTLYIAEYEINSYQHDDKIVKL